MRVVVALLLIVFAIAAPASATAEPSPPAPDAPAPSAPPGFEPSTPVLPEPPMPEITRGPLFHPDGPGRYKLRVSAGALLDVLPKRVVESEARQLPQITANARFGLPYGFSASARLAAIVVKNNLDLGVIYAHRFGDVSVSVQDHFGVVYGSVAFEGFDTTTWSFSQTPGVTVGVPWKHIRFSLTTELLTTFQQHTRLGDAQILSRRRFSIAGVSSMLMVETLLDAGGDIYFGLGALWTEPDYQAWLAFTDERVRILYPRLVAGYAF